MKKTICSIMLSTMCFSMLFCGCRKKEAIEAVEQKKEPVKEESVEAVKEEAKEIVFKTGLYSMEYEEEFADGMETFTNYIYFGDEGKGFYIVQDDVPITYADGRFTDDSGNSYSYSMTAEDTLELDDGTYKTEYKYAGKDIPEAVLDDMKYFKDGTLKVTNEEAGYALEDLITSDTITFYGLKSQKDYIAEGDDLEGMRAAYMELTDAKLSVLFIKTPNAPKEVGYEHVLQYVDGKIFDVIGLDKVEAVYKDAGVIVASEEDESGKTVYYYKPDSNGELYVFAAKNEGNSSYRFYDELGTVSETSEEEFNEAIKEVTGESETIEAIEEIDWKTLDKAI